jgi:parallel beta-helix repeat protein
MDKQRHSFSASRSPLVGAAVTVIGLGAILPLTASAGGSTLTCGSVVTTDVRLDDDLLDCAGSGLVIGASGITIDLAGHVVDGTGTGAGIDNEGGHDDVRIVGGTVREFQFGVHLFETSGGQVERFSAASNMVGVIVERSHGVHLDRVHASDNVSNGIDVTFSERISVRRSTAAGNGLSGIVDRFTQESTYERNTVTGNSSPGLVLNGSDGVVARRNQAATNDSTGIELTLVEDGVIARNEAIANAGDGIFADQPGNTVARNRAVANQGIGIAVPEGTIDGGRNRAKGNLGGDCTGVVC